MFSLSPAAADLRSTCAGINGLCIQFPELASFCGRLPPDEQDEQLRDLALYGLMAKLDITPSDPQPPLRYPQLKKKSPDEISPGRIRNLSSDDAILLIGNEHADDLPLIGSLLDDHRAAGMQLPANVHLFTYRTDTSSAVTVSYLRTIRGKDAFSAPYGYVEQEIRSLDELRSFLEKIDDLTEVRWLPSGIVCAGRKFRKDARAALPLEAVAALYQAYNDPPGVEEQRRQAYNDFINKKYEEVVRNDKRLRRMIRERKIKSFQIFAELKRKIPYRTAGQGSHVGFSLDPKHDIGKIADNLDRIVRRDPAVVPPSEEFNVFIDSHAAEITATATALRKQNSFEKFLVQRRRYAGAKDRAASYFDHLLQETELDASYQAARYDGRLQGTLPGMLLFYTDLTAKLWALDFQGTAPRGKIRGFRAMDEIRVPRLYWDDFVRLSKTRLWFGIKPEGFDINENTLRFAPVATRVYAASSSPLTPGKETTPNYQSAEFLGWWDRHYAAIAEFEPEYHRLNQIQKWGCVFMVLSEKQSHTLDFLFSVPVARDLDFQSWYKDAAWLTSRIDLPFLDRKTYNASTECFLLLRSGNYPLMGQRFFLSGGVSLASRKDILAKLNKSKTVASAARNTTRRTATLLPSAPARAAAGTGTRKGAIAAKRNVRTDSTLGRLNARKDAQGVTLQWERGATVIAGDIVDELVARQESRQAGYKDERIFAGLQNVEKVVRVEGGKTYLLKSGRNNGWILLKLNDRSGDFPVKRSGSEPDADLFFAKPVTGRQVEAMRMKDSFVEIVNR